MNPGRGGGLNSAFVSFRSEYEPKVRARLRRFAEDEDHLDDLLQDTWKRCLERWDQFKDGDRGAWALAVAWSVGVDSYRKKRCRRQSTGLGGTKPERDDPSLGLEVEELRAQLNRLMVTALTSREREVLNARFFGDLSTAEVSKTLGLSESTVRVHLSNAMKKLRPIIQRT